MTDFNIRTTRNTPNGEILVSVPQGTANTTRTSLILFGKNFANYGTAINQDMVHLMENFADQVPPASPLEGQLWFDTISSELKIWQKNAQNNFQWQLVNARSLQNIAESIVPNRLYVSKSGKDSNSGLSWFNAKATIKGACDAAAQLLATGELEEEHVSVLVASGDYTEVTPIIVPAGVSIIGDNLRAVTVRPRADLVTQNVFLMDSATYAYGLTVRDHKLEPSALDITPVPGAPTTVSASLSAVTPENINVLTFGSVSETSLALVSIGSLVTTNYTLPGGGSPIPNGTTVTGKDGTLVTLSASVGGEIPATSQITFTVPTPDATPYANASGRNLPRNTVQTGFAFSFRPNVDILVSPYIQNCSSISGDPGTGSGIYPGGGGVLVDPSVLGSNNRINSIVVDAFTQINLGGIGVKVVGKGYMQLVSFFINFCQFGLLCVDGGHVTALNSNCSFGNYSLWAEGFRYLENLPQDGLAGAVNQTWPGTGSQKTFETTANTKVYDDQLDDLEVQVIDNTGAIVPTAYTVTSVADGALNNSLISISPAPSVGETVRARIRFGSLIEASGYTMSYVGAGLSYNRLSASQGGVGRADPNKYTILKNQPSVEDPATFVSYGRIYHTTTDESGDFYVGAVTPGEIDPETQEQSPGRPSFRINQRRGAIDGRAFYQSIFGFMAPFVLALTRRGK
jgi:hypothetical protein